ncbi:MAG: hypothetical protein IIA58_01750 [Candidatus Marinimicrobia bacterium]|nr:hypothetical protein [Candidatus Neomarinimicrobiota bacterium]
MRTFSIKVLLSFILTIFIVSCDKDDNIENVDESFIEETFQYSINTDKTTYSFLDTIHWNASFANLSDDTISFDDHGTGRFFSWIMVDTLGTYLDGWVHIDCVFVYSLMPGDVLEDHWTTVLNSFFYRYLSSGYYYGIMKPWYNYDSLNFDTTEFYITTLVSEEGYKKLYINTDTTTYTWQQGESKDYIFIRGTITNESDSTFYSRLGDGFGPSEPEELVIACNSWGYIEKFNESDNLWKESDICLFLIEGSKIVPVKPSQVYSIYSDLAKNRDENETGIYRIRIDYYDIENPDSIATPFHDYSNLFEIK